jgi:4-diphosphocytidyl-2-C-methyl-D-erythritol kinase
MPPLTTRAPAKVNLSLHVLGRRLDGYHELESLVAFAATGDTLALTPGPELRLDVAGPKAPLAGLDADNLVLRAARNLAEAHGSLRLGSFHLVKRLPVAAGIGGGSADAAAALRLVARLNGLPLDHPAVTQAARRTGADVPVCLVPRARMMSGAGETVGPALKLPRLFAVLINPGVPVATPAVFHALGLSPGETVAAGAHPDIEPGLGGETLLDRLATGRNDLEAPACRLAPEITEALESLRRAHGIRLARMSGSGATVFGVFDGCAAAADAAKAVARAQPRWWVKATSLG